MTSLRKKRLTDNDRQILVDHSRTLVVAPKDTEKLADKAEKDSAKAQAKCQAHMVRLAEKQVPPADLKVLKKYNATTTVSKLRIISRQETQDGTFHDQVDEFVLEEDTFVTLPKDKVDRYGETSLPLILDAPALAALNKWVSVKEESYLILHEREDARAQLLRDYRALIIGARTFEDLVEVWPEASQVKDQIVPVGTGLSALSADAMDRIRADIAGRVQ